MPVHFRVIGTVPLHRNMACFLALQSHMRARYRRGDWWLTPAFPCRCSGCEGCLDGGLVCSSHTVLPRRHRLVILDQHLVVGFGLAPPEVIVPQRDRLARPRRYGLHRLDLRQGIGRNNVRPAVRRPLRQILIAGGFVRVRYERNGEITGQGRVLGLPQIGFLLSIVSFYRGIDGLAPHDGRYLFIT